MTIHDYLEECILLLTVSSVVERFQVVKKRRAYCKWAGLRQTCLAHLIRDAKKLSESLNIDIMLFGKWVLKDLQCLCHMANAPPSEKEWEAFYSRLMQIITRFRGNKDATNTFARRLEREIAHLWVFLEQEGVSPTNNHAERIIRFGSDKGNRWVERILSLRQTCRLRSLKTYPILVGTIRCHFKEQEPNLSRVARH